MRYYLMIDRFLHELSCNGKVKKSDIETELLDYLKLKGCRLSRYKIYKTTRESFDLYHSELEALLCFFEKKFKEVIDSVKETRHKKSLRLWCPADYDDLYYSKSTNATSANVRAIAKAS